MPLTWLNQQKKGCWLVAEGLAIQDSNKTHALAVQQQIMALKSHASGYKTNSSSHTGHTNSTKLWVEIRNCATTLSTPQIQSNTLLYIIHNLPIETVIHWDIQPNLAGYIPQYPKIVSPSKSCIRPIHIIPVNQHNQHGYGKSSLYRSTHSKL